MPTPVSIIIPSYNALAYLPETLESALAQDWPNLEIIVVDDGSTDDTANWIQPYLSDPRLRYVRQDNAGVSAARNHGTRLAKGEYLAFCDSDDVLLPGNVRAKAELLDAQPQVGMCHTWMAVIDEKSRPSGEEKRGKAGWVLDELLAWNGDVIPAPSSILVRRSAIEAVGGFDTRLSTAADQEFFFRVAAKFEVGMVPKALGQYRVLPNSMSRNIAKMESDHLLAYQLADEYKLFKSAAFRRHCFANLYLILAGSWAVNGHNRRRAAYWVLRALALNPGKIISLIKKKI